MLVVPTGSPCYHMRKVGGVCSYSLRIGRFSSENLTAIPSRPSVICGFQAYQDGGSSNAY